jgi:hypothetical protein
VFERALKAPLCGFALEDARVYKVSETENVVSSTTATGTEGLACSQTESAR